uniref:MarR-like transcriptional regulator n=1 Tax=Goodfellowiella coeruleoviolacea TaxID=334858 RepID=V5RN16_9PSEU|nr:MarR-like transcriptional regulator [Goodfellowiella coeruleoviolacea]
MPGPEPRLVDLLTAAQRVLWRELGERLAEENVGVEQWRVLRALAEAEGMSMRELAERVQVPAPSLTRLVDSLVDQARVYRRQSVHDGRRIDVHLSATGRELLDRLEAIAAAHERQVTASLGRPNGEVTATVAALARLSPPLLLSAQPDS